MIGFTCVIVFMHMFYNDVLQMWKIADGSCIAEVSGRGIGVRPMVYFKDNKRVASAQESAVLVSQ